LSISQDQLEIKGHSLELRIYAEDPLNDFLPSVGKLEQYSLSEEKGVRLDSGYREGMEIPIYYDPMIAKLISYGSSRIEAIQILKKAIKNFKLKGIESTLSFGLFVCENEHFINGDFDTHFVKKYYSADKIIEAKTEKARIASKLALRLFLDEQKILKVSDHNNSNWLDSRK
jgi:acetyl/propionyl-CoA carboxylase alpha subunit